MNCTKLLVSTAVACLLVATVHGPVLAADSEAGGTKSKAATDYRGLYGGVGVGVADYQHGGSEALWRLDVWLRLFTYGSLQVGYVDLGDPGSGDNDGITYAAVPQLPLGERFTLHAKVGGTTQTSNDTSTDLVLGGGFSVSLPYDLGVRAEYEHYTFDNDVNAVSFSLFYKFGSF